MNARYQKNKAEPVGNTQLKADGFDFRSSSYEWLVLAGSNDQYEGTGTVNGAGNFGFLLMKVRRAGVPVLHEAQRFLQPGRP